MTYLNKLCINISYNVKFKVREPVEQVHADHKDLDEWEIVLYILSLSFAIEGGLLGILMIIPLTDNI